MRWQWGDIVPDYLVGRDAACLFLSLRWDCRAAAAGAELRWGCAGAAAGAEVHPLGQRQASLALAQSPNLPCPASSTSPAHGLTPLRLTHPPLHPPPLTTSDHQYPPPPPPSTARYHLLKPEYIHARIKELQRSFRLRIILCHVDTEDAVEPLAQVLGAGRWRHGRWQGLAPRRADATATRRRTPVWARHRQLRPLRVFLPPCQVTRAPAPSPLPTRLSLSPALHPATQVTRAAIGNECTLICGWSNQECARYLETFKRWVWRGRGVGVRWGRPGQSSEGCSRCREARGEHQGKACVHGGGLQRESEEPTGPPPWAALPCPPAAATKTSLRK